MGRKMQTSLQTKLLRALAILAGLLVVKVAASIVLVYRDYLPPNFESAFLNGRQSYFFGAYHWAFYTHIACGPVTLLLGLVLISDRFRQRFPHWHRSLGKVQIALVLLLLAPSGLWMAPYAETGAVAATGFSALAVATWTCALLGWRTAVRKRFAEHRRWMWRCFLLLCSAVVLRLIGGLDTMTGVGGASSYPLAAWASWLVPLAIFELGGAIRRRYSRPSVQNATYLPPAPASIALAGGKSA